MDNGHLAELDREIEKAVSLLSLGAWQGSRARQGEGA